MITCKNCGVGLENDMLKCPLCGFPVDDTHERPVASPGSKPAPAGQAMSPPQKKFIWEIVTIILLSGMVTTFGIDMLLNKTVTWSTYPVAVCLVTFSYLSLFAFWHRRIYWQLTGSFILSAFFLVVFDLLTGHSGWSFRLALPLLLVSNLVVGTLLVIVRSAQYKGINLLGYGFVGVALLCISIEGILSHYLTGDIRLQWSVIVAGCIVPVIVVLLFVHFRLKKGRSLERIFHI